MSKNEKSSGGASGGIGFVGVLTVAFVVLKLTKVIDWTWGWVLSPLWISLAVVVAILLIVMLMQYIINK